jgi:integrase/recombinase XerD
MHIIEDYLSYLSTLGYRPNTIAVKGQRLQHFNKAMHPKRLLEIDQIDIEHYYKILQENKTEVQLKTVNIYMLTVAQFYDWLCLLAQLKAHPFGSFTIIKDTSKATRNPIPIHIIKQLYKACTTPKEKLLLIFCYACGLRAAELQQLKVKAILLDKNMIIVQSGKGNKRRYIPLKQKHINFIEQYIISHNKEPNHYILTTSNTQISQYLLRKILRELQKRISLKKPFFSLHHLRHSIASHLVDNDVSIQLVQHFLGHQSLETTQNYVKTTTTLHYYGTSKTMGNKTQQIHRENL